MQEHGKRDGVAEEIRRTMELLNITSPDDLGIDLSTLKSGAETTDFIREKVAHLEGEDRERAKSYVEGVIAVKRFDENNEKKT